jgi:hypothetical protein
VRGGGGSIRFQFPISTRAGARVGFGPFLNGFSQSFDWEPGTVKAPCGVLSNFFYFFRTGEL